MSKFDAFPPVPDDILDRLPNGYYDENNHYIRPSYDGCLYRPMTEWSKAAILDTIRDLGYPECVQLSINALTLDEAREGVLVCVGWAYRGRITTRSPMTMGKRALFYTIDRVSLDALTEEFREELYG